MKPVIGSIATAYWNSLTDYPSLWFNGAVESGPRSHRYVLSSKREAIAYCSWATAKEGVKFKSQTLRLKGLFLVDGTYKMDIIRPDSGVVSSPTVTVGQGALSVKLPAFTDDIAVHLH